MGRSSRGHTEGPAAATGVRKVNAIEKERLLSFASTVFPLDVRDRLERVK